MPTSIEGKKNAEGLKIGIIVSRYNHFVVHVPGAFEIPLIAEKMAASGRYDALVCLGAVIRGDTPHFDYVCDAVTRGVGDAIRSYRIPIGFGVLTTNDVQQAMERSGTKDANKGYEALLTVVEMISVIRQLP